MNPQLVEHTAAVQRDLQLLDYPRRPWLSERRTKAGAPIYDVVIVGGGQSGLVTAFGLMRERVTNVLVLDQNPLDRAGPWLNFARMHTLRTPKYLTGPDLGIPSLTPRAWYESQHGPNSWETLGLVPKETWAAYLKWYRETLAIPVRPEARVGALQYLPEEACWEVPYDLHGAAHSAFARRVVLATGIEGSGAWTVPEFITSKLARTSYAHTRDDIDFDALRGKRIAVLGAGASAFDNASVALEKGAAEVRLCFRRAQLVNVNAYRWAEFVGFLAHFGELGDADKWRFIREILRMGQLPPTDTFHRATRHTNFHLMPSCPWFGVEQRGNVVVIDTPHGPVETDFIIAATGFVTDLKRRPELQHVEQHIARWGERYQPPANESHEDLARHPYLGPHFEFTEKKPGDAPHLSTLYNYTFGGLLSLGFGGASISGMKYSIPRLVSGITSSLFVEDRERHFHSLCTFSEREF